MKPASLPELCDMVRATPRVLAVGARTKPRLSAVEAEKIDMAGLSGLVEYEPDEFTFTALAGTPLRDMAAALAEKGQYLPFDPMLLDAGATLGGTVAAGLNGPGRFRYGGLKDFILGVRFVDGTGRLLRMGGKVVKNAAGFDLPKFFVGSLGRFGVLAEITMKVFPLPPATRTLRLRGDAVEILREVPRSRWEAHAVDLLPDGDVALRLGAPPEALEKISAQILARWSGEILSPGAAAALWAGLREFRWAHEGGALVKVAATPDALPPAPLRHVSAAGSIAYLSFPGEPSGDFPGLSLRGPGPLWLKPRPVPAVEKAIKQALDPANRFPDLND